MHSGPFGCSGAFTCFAQMESAGFPLWRLQAHKSPPLSLCVSSTNNTCVQAVPHPGTQPVSETPADLHLNTERMTDDMHIQI